MADIVTLTAEQQTALQIVFEVFHKEATWPTVQRVNYALDERDLQSAEILASLPTDMAQFDRMPAASGAIALTVLGLSQCDGAKRELDLFLRAVQWFAEREKRFRPSPTENEQLELTSTEFAEHIGDLSRKDLVQVAEVVRQEWRLRIGFSGPNTDEPTWTVRLNEGIRPYRGVTSIAEYLAVVRRAAGDGRATMVGSSVYPATAAPTATLSSIESYDLTAIHPLIQDAAAALFAGAHYRQAVLDAIVALRDLIREKSGLNESDGSTLMGKALGGDAPRIAVADLSTETGRNLQRGTAHLAQGILARLRNPLTHERVELDYLEAIEMLAIISRVARDVDTGVLHNPRTPADGEAAASGDATSAEAV